MAEPTHRYVGEVAREFELSNGKLPWLAPGDFITLNDEDAKKYKEDVDNGTLLALEKSKK